VFRLPGDALLLGYDNDGSQTQLNFFFSEVLDRASNRLEWRSLVREREMLAGGGGEGFLVRRVRLTADMVRLE